MAVVQKTGSIQEAVYRELKRGIMMLQLKPGSTMSTQEMADRLYVSRNTCKTHMAHIYAKMGIHTRAQLDEILRS